MFAGRLQDGGSAATINDGLKLQGRRAAPSQWRNTAAPPSPKPGLRVRANSLGVRPVAKAESRTLPHVRVQIFITERIADQIVEGVDLSLQNR
jgi:hypothetical protein